MIAWQLSEITTKDKFIHQGLYWQPAKSSGLGILWVHGLTDNCYGDKELVEALAEGAESLGIAVASFNTRGHDIVASVKKVDPGSPKGHTSVNGGSSYESFVDCVYDIEAGIAFLASHGFTRVVIAGISTGANKVGYYAGTNNDSRVAGVILASPISDVAIRLIELGDQYEVTLQKAQKLITDGKGDMLVEGLDFMPMTPKRFISLATKHGEEDVFPYYDGSPNFRTLNQIKVPVLTLFAGADEYSDRPIADVSSIFEKYVKGPKLTSVIISDTFHSFGGKEKDAAKAIVDWVQKL